jgi:hypothetical protein
MSDEAPPSSASQSSATQTSETSDGSFAFVHSQDTLNHSLPPNVDNKSLARQKRRRTRYVSGTT